MLGKRLDRMFEGADMLLMSMSERSRNHEEQRRYFDAKALVRKHRAALAKTFRDELAAGFLPGAETRRKPESPEVSFDELRMAKTRTIEESIAVNNIAVKAENHNDKTLFEIGRRLEWLVNEKGAAASPQALAPATVCNAFRVSTQSLNLDFQDELVMYKLFDQLVVGLLSEVYAEALKLLERGGVTAAVLKTAPPRVAQPVRNPDRPAPQGGSPTQGFAAQAFGAPGGATRGFPAVGAPESPASGPMTGSMPGPMTGAMPALDPRTLDALRSVQGSGVVSAANYGDADLATELAQLASGQAVAGWAPSQARANMQAADLVGRMFNGIVEDASVPPALKAQLDDLRFAVIKNALADSTFFSNADHPVRRLINELATMAATARATGTGSIGQLASLVSAVQSQFQVAAHAARNAAAAATPLADVDAERFLDDQLVQAKARRQALIDRARQVVREVLDLRLLGRSIPDEARPMLLAGVSPLLGLRLLRKGMESESWREGVALMEQVIHALDPAVAAAPGAVPSEQLCARIERELLAAGMVVARSNELLEGLRKALELAERQRSTSPAVTSEIPIAPPPTERPLDLLLRLLVPGQWFKVYDAGRQQTRWLKVLAQYLEDAKSEYSGHVAFSEFSGENVLMVQVDTLLDQLAAGLAEPFDQSPASRAALTELVSRQQARKAAAPDLPT